MSPLRNSWAACRTPGRICTHRYSSSLGHLGCVAVAAARDTKAHGTEHKSRIQILVDGIQPGLSDPDPHLSPEAQLEKAVEENLRWSIGQLLATPEGKSALEGGRATILGAVYEIATGKVRFLA